jgi:hypothetical protein
MTYPTTFKVCTNAVQFSITCDPSRFNYVNYRLQELCPAARDWDWVECAARHPETGRFTKAMTVTVNGEFTSLRRRLAAKLPTSEYALSDELLAEVA